jgi:DNA processing protein
MQDDATDRLRLARTHRVGPIAYAQLISRFGSAGAALAALPDLARRSGGTGNPIPPQGVIQGEIAAVAALGGRHVFIDDADYPPLLREAHAAPPVLMVMGDASLLSRRTVAIVGARNSSAAACRFARLLAHALGEQGIIIVSGLARGIDTSAHEGALSSGTVGVIACGLDVFFPPQNEALQRQLAAEHLVVTEYPPGTEPLARQFPHRNRIIAWATSGTVVVEAAPKSGSLLTARLANEAGREVMAVPGSPLDPRAQGCNALIRDGATLVQSADDIIEAIGAPGFAGVREPAAEGYPAAGSEPGDAERQEIERLLGPVPVSIDELVRQSGLSSAMVQTILVELEIVGLVQRHAGARVSSS